MTGLLVATVLALAFLCLLSIAYGTRSIPLGDVARALVDRGDGEVDAIVWDVRIPRTALGLLAGAALGLAGAVMQGLTRNPLADPGLLGVSAGAGFATVVAVAFLGVSSLYGYIWFTFAGALVASVVVYLLGGTGGGGSTPAKLALAGVALTALLNSLSSGIVLVDAEALDRYRFWAVGSLAGQDADVLWQVLPFFLVGVGLALGLAPAMNSLMLGDDVAAALGRRPRLTRVTGAVAVTLLTGAAVAVAGPIVFIGLLVPHVARLLVGPDNRWLLPFSMTLAPCLLLGADVLGRVVARPQEVQVGVIAAALGAPFFIVLIRRRRLAELS
ncbi:iron chelate uptake ABC transporter family permease subunit [Frankia sp. CNm7]|uniref:FecCD family ABC transporter permease n=1 Tax=Frankia nepalensis TaxID=1836974 RepID=UPI001E0FF06A|nr:iron chelate uptake ABC transporter family permease subunit [Frankia nepalensis]MBL7513030.1 iron chelate uptake ABC transporter family permease subunit [Frankia nepalensis]MBL7518369.1 iron chelate uptake ABC transporter family permease subunit [Frankia nepalensis]